MYIFLYDRSNNQLFSIWRWVHLRHFHISDKQYLQNLNFWQSIIQCKISTSFLRIAPFYYIFYLLELGTIVFWKTQHGLFFSLYGLRFILKFKWHTVLHCYAFCCIITWIIFIWLQYAWNAFSGHDYVRYGPPFMELAIKHYKFHAELAFDSVIVSRYEEAQTCKFSVCH